MMGWFKPRPRFKWAPHPLIPLPVLVLDEGQALDAAPLFFIRWRDGRAVMPELAEDGCAVVRSRPTPWKEGHGRRRNDWDDWR